MKRSLLTEIAVAQKRIAPDWKLTELKFLAVRSVSSSGVDDETKEREHVLEAVAALLLWLERDE